MPESLIKPGFASIPGVPLRPNTFLKIRGISSNNAAAVSFNYTVVLPDGQVTINRQTFTFTSKYSAQLKTYALPEGTLINLTVSTTSTTQRRGITYITAGLQTGDDTSNEFQQILISDYVYLHYFPSWPNSPLRGSLEGKGNYLRNVESNPSAGQNKALTLQAGARRRIRTIHFTLTTDANVANRQVWIEIKNANYYGEFNAATTQPASTTSLYTATSHGHNTATGTDRIPIALPPDIELVSDDNLNIIVSNIQAGDQLSSIIPTYEEWLE